MKDDRISRFPAAHDDMHAVEGVPRTPQTESQAYRLAFDDEDFLCRDELRPVRLQLELQKPEMAMTALGIKSTIVLFGGARVPSPENAANAKTEGLRALAPYYEEARKMAYLCTKESLKTGGREDVVVTGGGPGVMEAGNRGAVDAGGRSIGLNIVLPHEQAPNEYITPELCFNFHYFAIRKMHFLMRAKAICVFPGGYGTMDELFEALTLIQTKRMDPVPFVLFGKAFWEEVVNWEALARAGTIAREDLDLFQFVDTADEALAIIQQST